jgi:uncharacterized protein YndB with AHSA1/START domain
MRTSAFRTGAAGLLALPLLALPLLALPLLGWAPTAATEKALRDGGAWTEVLADTEGAALIRAAVDIPAPPQTVWTVMTDCRLTFKMIADLTSCTVLEGDQRKGWDVREQVTHGNIFLPDIHNVVHSDYQPYSLIRFRRVGGNLKIEDGEWRLEPLDGGAGTRVIYINRVKADILAPAFLVRAGIRSSTPKVLLALRRESVAANAARKD